MTPSQQKAAQLASALETTLLQAMPTIRQLRRVLIMTEEDGRENGFTTAVFKPELCEAVTSIISLEEDMTRLVIALAPKRGE